MTDGQKLRYHRKNCAESYGRLQKIETGVVNGYKTIENGVVDGFRRVTDRCVETLFAREGETAEEAKARLSGRK